jgi:hypothetical protein
VRERLVSQRTGIINQIRGLHAGARDRRAPGAFVRGAVCCEGPAPVSCIEANRMLFIHFIDQVEKPSGGASFA